jgi:hypothetical protein
VATNELIEAASDALEELRGYADHGQSVKAEHICERLDAALAASKTRRDGLREAAAWVIAAIDDTFSDTFLDALRDRLATAMQLGGSHYVEKET